MFGIGKKTAWNAWLHCPEVTETMVTLMHQPEELTEDSVALNDWQCKCTTKTAHVPLLTTADVVHSQPEKPAVHPSTKAALYQHVKRAVFVSVFIWHGALARELRLPAPADYGCEWIHALKHGCLTGHIWKMLVLPVHYFCTVLATRPVRGGVNATEEG